MGSPGLGLIEARADAEDLRRRRLYLTPKGRRLAERIAMTLGLEAVHGAAT